MNYAINLTLTVRADSFEEAHEIAIGACEHLADTFNDDGSISASVPPLSMSPASPEGLRDILHRLIDWERRAEPDGAELQKLIEDAASLLEHGDAALPFGEAINIELTVPDQTCYDIICTAAEGGINYWSYLVSYKRQARADSNIHNITGFEADIIDGPVQCDHPDIEHAEIQRFICDADVIRQGIRRLLAPGALVSPAIRNDVMLQAIDPEHACDADSADSIVQFGVFGELLFG